VLRLGGLRRLGLLGEGRSVAGALPRAGAGSAHVGRGRYALPQQMLLNSPLAPNGGAFEDGSGRAAALP